MDLDLDWSLGAWDWRMGLLVCGCAGLGFGLALWDLLVRAFCDSLGMDLLVLPCFMRLSSDCVDDGCSSCFSPPQ